MKSEIKDVSSTQKELTIEIDAGRLKDAYGKVSQKYANKANVPGFRKGYAPVDVVRLRFKDEIRSEVLQEVVSLQRGNVLLTGVGNDAELVPGG